MTEKYNFGYEKPMTPAYKKMLFRKFMKHFHENMCKQMIEDYEREEIEKQNFYFGYDERWKE